MEYCGAELEVFSHARNWKRYWAATIAPYLGDEILDVGAGIGTTARVLNTRSYRRWVELEPDGRLVLAIKELQAKGEIPGAYEVVNGISSDLPEDRQFDTILYVDVLEHIGEDSGELARVARLLSAGGHIIVVAPAYNWLFSEFDRQVGHLRRYAAADFVRIKPACCKIVKLSYLDSVGLLASLANRWFLKSGSPGLRQIKFWDGFLVPASRLVDRLLMGKVGKTIVCVMKKVDEHQ
jgi:SAM-dependent methyltransferase